MFFSPDDNEHDVPIKADDADKKSYEDRGSMDAWERLRFCYETPSGVNNPEKKYVTDIVTMGIHGRDEFRRRQGSRPQLQHVEDQKSDGNVPTPPRGAKQTPGAMGARIHQGRITAGTRNGALRRPSSESPRRPSWFIVITWILWITSWPGPWWGSGSARGPGGIKGGVAGAVIGSGLGLVSGVCTKGVEMMAGETTEARYVNYRRLLQKEQEAAELKQKMAVEEHNEKRAIWTDEDMLNKQYKRNYEEDVSIKYLRKAIIQFREYTKWF